MHCYQRLKNVNITLVLRYPVNSEVTAQRTPIVANCYLQATVCTFLSYLAYIVVSSIITSPARDSGGAEYCNWFVLATMCTNPTLSGPTISADQSRASIWGRDLISPGWLMEQPSLFHTAGN